MCGGGGGGGGGVGGEVFIYVCSTPFTEHNSNKKIKKPTKKHPYK